MLDHPTGALADALTMCGIDSNSVAIEWDDLCQEEVLTFAQNPYSETSLASLAELYLTFGCRFVFPDETLQQRFDQAVQRTPKMQALMGQLQQERLGRVEAASLSGFQGYDPSTETLKAFTHRIEAAVGFLTGEILSVSSSDSITVAPTGPIQFAPDNLSLLLALLERAAPQVSVLLAIGSEDE